MLHHGSALHDERCCFVIVKESSLELVAYSPVDKTINLLSRRHVFGSIKSVALFPLQPRTIAHVPSDRFYSFDDESYTSSSGDKVGLLCTSDSGKLSLISCSISNQKFNFLSEICAVEQAENDCHVIGRATAVDPFGRAVVSIAYRDVLRVWLVPSPELTKSKSQAIFEEGVIWNVSFLRPKALTDPTSFVLVVSRNSLFFAVVYQLDHGAGLREISRREILFGEDTPTLAIIPLDSVPDHFLLVSELRVILCRSGPTEVCIVSEMRFPGAPMNDYIITSWSRRDVGFLETLENGVVREEFYLSSDTGVTLKLIVRSNPAHVGSLHEGVTTFLNPRIEIVVLGLRRPTASIITLKSDAQGDIIMLAGEMCDGEVVSVDSGSNTVVRECRIPNWAPILDFKVSGHQGGGHALYATSGMSPFGSVRNVQNNVNVEVETVNREYSGISNMWSLKLRAEEEEEAHSFLALSFVAGTRLLQLHGEEFVDISNQSNFEIDRSSVFFCSLPTIPNYLVQVHSSGVVAIKIVATGNDFKTGKPVNWEPDSSYIGIADLNGDLLFLSVMPKGTIICVRLFHDGSSLRIEKLTSFTLPDEATSLYCPPESFQRHSFGSSIVCFVGTYRSTLLTITKDEESRELSAKKLASISSSPHDSKIPQSICLLDEGSVTYLVIGLRNGCIAHYRLGNIGGAVPALDRFAIRRVGYMPVKVIGSATNRKGAIVLADRPWRLNVNDLGVEIHPISFSTVRVAANFDYHPNMSSYFFATEGALYLTSIDGERKNFMRNMGTAETPRRVVFDDATGMLLVAVGTSKHGQTALEIRVVHPSTGEVKLVEPVIGHTSILAMTVWKVKQGRRYICIGTSSLGSGGWVLVFNLKIVDNGSYRMKQLGEFRMSDKVGAISPFMNSYLLAAAGVNLHLLKIDAATRKLISGAHTEVRWPIQSLSTFGPRIVVGGQKESLTFYSYDPRQRKFELLKSDRHPRLTLDTLAIDQSTAMGTDKLGGVFALSLGSPFNTEICLESVFAINLGEVITRLHFGCMVQKSEIEKDDGVRDLIAEETLISDLASTDIADDIQLDLGWSSPQPSSISNLSALASSSDAIGFGDSLTANIPLTWARIREGVQNTRSARSSNSAHSVVYGTSMLGSIYAFLRIPVRLFERLLLLQSILALHPVTKPLLGNDHYEFRSKYFPMHGVVDGEMVTQFVELLDPVQQQEVVDRMNRDWELEQPLEAILEQPLTVATLRKIIITLNSKC
ncbi:mono-functional DNA-alkylating methyl methanesulfonate N-term-domain-containing protein [Cladochytrium replicatum]|nr:mono-functional DNA-alkylating methyl methanesulfonate N-term-domain-containing protein [Cladochytrium replicatum]